MLAYTNYKTDPRVIREAEAAVRGGFEVDFIALRRESEPAEELVNGVRLIHLNQRRYRGRGRLRYVLSYAEFFIRCALLATRLQLRRGYSVVHVNNMPDALVFCALVPKMLGARVVLDIHDPMPNTFSSKYRAAEGNWFFKLLLWQEQASAWFADAVLTVSEPVKAHLLVSQHGLAAAKVEVIANFADDRLFQLRVPPPLERPLKLVFHGTVVERYGLGNAMHAFARVHDRGALHLTVIGEGDFSDSLRSLIAELGIGDAVTFENRMYPLHQMPAILSGFHVGFVPMELSSVTDYALPLKLLEYTMLGIPSIAVRSVAVQHYFGEEDCLYYDPTVPDGLVGVLNRIAADPSVVRVYERRAVALRASLKWSHQGDRYVALLRGLIGESGSR